MSEAGKRSAAGRQASSSDAVSQSAQDLVRAAGGGLLIGLPLLFTMEMWWHGFLLPQWKILLLLGVTFLIVIGYSALSGFRRDRSVLQLVVDSVQTMGIAAVVATLALLALGRIGPDMGLREVIGKIALQMIPIAFGASLAATQLAAPEEDDAEETGSEAGDRAAVGTVGRLFVAAGAALLFALNVAATEEPMLLGIAAGPWLLVGVVAGSYLVTLAIVFYADFRGGLSGAIGEGVLNRPYTETAAAYAISLIVSLLLLWSFGRTDGMGVSAVIGQVVMLGVVASFGAAAGRLLVGGGAKAGGAQAGGA
jgi:putative integral membrane protein (TIGR02587 family)